MFAKPEDARALKELYPGGVEQARAAAERARTLEEIDSSFYGEAGKSPEQLSAGRTALAQRMLREDPAAFREMVFAGLRALEAAATSPNVAAAFRPPSVNSARAVDTEDGHLKVSATRSANPNRQIETQNESSPTRTQTAIDPGYANQYAAFEKSANEELERSVGGAISRALAQALPNVAKPDESATVGARYIVPLQQRLGGVIREDVEAALKGDRQLGEQIAQVLSTRRFDDTTRAQVVRLINDRAQQLVPSAAKRVIQEWTQTAFASHRAHTQPSAEANNQTNASRGFAAQHNGQTDRDAASLNREDRSNSARSSAKAAAADRAENAVRASQRATSRLPGRSANLDYRKLSDEQILDLS